MYYHKKFLKLASINSGPLQISVTNSNKKKSNDSEVRIIDTDAVTLEQERDDKIAASV